MSGDEELMVWRLAQAMRTAELEALLRKPLDVDAARVEWDRRRNMPTLFEAAK